jgi:hypothetical protein
MVGNEGVGRSLFIKGGEYWKGIRPSIICVEREVFSHFICINISLHFIF